MWHYISDLLIIHTTSSFVAILTTTATRGRHHDCNQLLEQSTNIVDYLKMTTCVNLHCTLDRIMDISKKKFYLSYFSLHSFSRATAQEGGKNYKYTAKQLPCSSLRMYLEPFSSVFSVAMLQTRDVWYKKNWSSVCHVESHSFHSIFIHKYRNCVSAKYLLSAISSD